MNIIKNKPADWEICKLGSVATYINGAAFKPADWGNHGLPIIRIEQINNPYLVNDYFDGEISEKYLVNNGDLIFSWSATLKVIIWEYGKGVLNQHIFKVVPATTIDKYFLYYTLDFNMKNLANQSHGSTMQHIKRADLLPFKIITPPFLEQQKISKILATVDNAIEKTESLIEKYKNIKQGLMQDLLMKGIDEHGNIRSEETHEFKDSPIGRIPKEWDVDSLQNVCDKIKDGTHFSPKTYSQGSFRYMTSKNIRFGFLDVSNCEYVRFEDHQEIFSRCPVEYGDLLLTKDGANTGNLAINTLQEEFSLLSSVAVICGRPNIVLNQFLLQWFMSHYGQKTIKDSMTGLAITRITLQIINQFVVPIPKIDEQKRIVERLNQVDLYIWKEEAYFIKLKQLKQGLMQDLLTGKVRVPLEEETR